MGDNPKVFLSYASEDREVVHHIFALLERLGFEPWMDRDRIIGGDNWQSDIYQGISEARFFIACLSPNSVAKISFVWKEFELALNTMPKLFPQKPFTVIPLVLGDCVIPTIFSSLHWLKWANQDALIDLLIALDQDRHALSTLKTLIPNLITGNLEKRKAVAQQIAAIQTLPALVCLQEWYYREPDAANRCWLAYSIGYFGTAKALDILLELEEWEVVEKVKAEASDQCQHDFALEGIADAKKACEFLLARIAEGSLKNDPG